MSGRRNGVSLCILAKNEEACIGDTIRSVGSIADEVLVANDWSSDSTADVARGLGARVLTLPTSVYELGFGRAVTWMIQQATSLWVLLLDADEVMPEATRLPELLRYRNHFAWNLPRRKWANLLGGVRCEYESYPDWQTRLVRTDQGVEYSGELHTRFSGARVHYAYRGPHIEHRHDELRTAEKIAQRSGLYKTLAAIQRVEIHGGYIKPQDNGR